MDNRFDDRTSEELGYYVYALIDPSDGKPFYVGKGQGNRVFAHANEALETSYPTDKLDRVRQIVQESGYVKHIVLRHGLDESTALTVESAILDFSSLFEVDLTNLVRGYHASAFGVMTTDELIRKFNAPPLEQLGAGCVLININRRYAEAKGAAKIYDVTKGYWVMRNPDDYGIKFALAEYRSFVVEVFEIDSWHRDPNGGRRWGFEGQVASESVRSQYLNRKIFKKRGSANPISYNLQTA